jgi:hypothetical protein
MYPSYAKQGHIELAYPPRLIFAVADSTRASGASNFVYSVQACGDYIHLTSGFYSVMVSELHRLRVHTSFIYRDNHWHPSLIRSHISCSVTPSVPSFHCFILHEEHLCPKPTGHTWHNSPH